MKIYEALISLPYSFSAYEMVTLKERFERELKSFLGDNEAEVVYLTESE